MTEHPATLLKRLEGRARKRFGQNFLAAESVVADIVALADLAPGGRVVEIGPGLGELTAALLAAEARVVAVELDRDLAAFLGERFAPALASGQLTLWREDALGVDWSTRLDGSGWTVVANLPYNVGTRILTGLLGRPDTFRRLVVMLQKEVAERIVAPPADRRRGSLSVFAQARAHVRLGLRVRPGAFHPVPKVESAVVVADLLPGSLPERHEQVVQALFAQPRKTLRNNLVAAFGRDTAERALAAAELAGERRPGTLDLEEIAGLASALAHCSQPRNT